MLRREIRPSSLNQYSVQYSNSSSIEFSICFVVRSTGGGLAWAAITGVGLAVASTPLQIQKATLGSVQPIRTVELTQRNCNLNALARIMDDTFCDKYYVCSDGKYVGLFCPIGMAFDYGLQECRFKHQVDCSKRPLICKF